MAAASLRLISVELTGIPHKHLATGLALLRPITRRLSMNGEHQDRGKRSRFLAPTAQYMAAQGNALGICVLMEFQSPVGATKIAPKPHIRMVYCGAHSACIPGSV